MDKTFSKIATLTLCLLVVHISSQGCKNADHIPSYLGKGYDILFGNPSTTTVDPGFRYEVVVFDYNKGITTEDKSFLIPDDISFSKVQSCSYSSTVN